MANAVAAVEIAVLGAGSWGTALAVLLARHGHDVRLWGHTPEHVRQLAVARRNERFLPSVAFPAGLRVCEGLEAATASADALVMAVPSHAFRAVLHQVKLVGSGAAPIISATKGFERGSGRLLHEVCADVLGGATEYAVLSGPTFAAEVARALPTAVTLACRRSDLAERLAGYFRGESFRVYTTEDVIGAETGGATKNVFAIAAGIADGLGFGANARAALVTRSIAEMMRLGVVLGGMRETFMGLAGIGDLMLTCTDDQSRNRRLGLAIGRGATLEQALREIGQVVEGVQTAGEAHRLALRCGVDMPIVEQVYAVLYEGRDPHDAVRQLLQREPKPERG